MAGANEVDGGVAEDEAPRLGVAAGSHDKKVDVPLGVFTGDHFIRVAGK